MKHNLTRAICTCALIAILSSCFFLPAPGEGEKAKQGYEDAKPVIEGLRRYHLHYGEYPSTLQALIPEYLPQESMTFISIQGYSHAFDYERSKQEYSLRFGYTGPGSNTCTYSPSVGWKCYGLY
jgi:hypothetical protein